MTDATLLTDRTRPALRLERHLPDPPETVWQALTDRDQLRSWFPSDLVVHGGRWEVGNTITFEFPPEVVDLTLSGEVLEVDEPHVLAFTWGEETLRFELTPDGAGTRLILVNELPAAAAARNAAGWEQCLDRLAGLDVAPHSWQPRFEAYASLFTPTLGHQEGMPEGVNGERHTRTDSYAKTNLRDVRDVALEHGLADIQEARFPAQDVGAEQTGMNFLTLKPGRRESFGHQHHTAEEIYVVLAGSGRVKLDEDLVELASRDILRVGPGVVRSLEAGTEGLEVVIFGPHVEGDVEVITDFWSE
jgi:uncharacterized protein YndB with AHSA1/START domain/mannose-6-phosphate isomerase-like protein (cupin superfamily)